MEIIATVADIVREPAPFPALLLDEAAAEDGPGRAAVAVESESVSMTDFEDELPQLRRLQQTEQQLLQRSGSRLEAAAANVQEAVATPSRPAAEERAEQLHSDQRQSQQQDGQQQQYEADSTVAAAERHSVASPIMPPSAPTTLQPQQPTSPPADTGAATATTAPCAYVAPLLEHLTTCRAAVTAAMNRYQQHLLDFDRAAVAPWQEAAVRHLKQQNETKRDMAESVQRVRDEIEEFYRKMSTWRDRSTRKRPAQ